MEAMFINPEKTIDAKLYSINQEMKASEMLREAQFIQTSNSVKKLLFALEE